VPPATIELISVCRTLLVAIINEYVPVVVLVKEDVNPFDVDVNCVGLVNWGFPAQFADPIYWFVQLAIYKDLAI
jgi:hypothetical protein